MPQYHKPNKQPRPERKLLQKVDVDAAKCSDSAKSRLKEKAKAAAKRLLKGK